MKKLLLLLVSVLSVACGQVIPSASVPTPTSEPTATLSATTHSESASPTLVPNLSPSPTTLANATVAPPAPTTELTIVDFPDASSVSVTAAGGAVYVALGQGENIFVARSLDGGATFGMPVQANLDAPATVMAIERPTIAADDEGYISVAWLQAVEGLLWYARSEDGGQTFGPSRQVTPVRRPHATLLGMAADDAHQPVLAWLEGHGTVAVARSQDDGDAIPGSRMVESKVCDCCQPQPIVLGRQILVAYRNLEAGENGEDVRDIYLLRSEDEGATFDEVRVSDAPWYFPACPISGPAVASDGETLYISWMDGRDDPNGDLSETDIWIANSADGGRTFSPNVQLTYEREGGAYNNLPSLIALPGGHLHIVWERADGNRYTLVYASSANGGQTWTAPQIIISSDDGSNRGRPQYATLAHTEQGRLHVAWTDNLGAHVASWMPQ